MSETTTGSITALRPLTEEEALAWLQAQPDGRTTMSQAALAARWGWSRHAVARRLNAWEKRGIVKRKGNAIVAAPAGAESPAPKPAPARTWTRASTRAVLQPGEGAPAHTVAPPAHEIARGPEHQPAPEAAPQAAQAPATAPAQRVLVTVREDEVTHRISAGDIMAYSVAAGLDGVAAWLGLHGFVVIFPAIPQAAIILCLTIEVAKLIGAGYVASHWRSVPVVWRLA